MKKYLQYSLVVFLAIVMVLIANGVWAAPGFGGTVPQPPFAGNSTGPKPIDMGTAIFYPLCNNDCTIEVNLITDPSKLAPAPKGFKFTGDTFSVTGRPQDSLVRACYSYPPEFSGKQAKIYRLNTLSTPNVWVEIPGSVVSDGLICVTTSGGVITLLGNP